LSLQAQVTLQEHNLLKDNCRLISVANVVIDKRGRSDF
jgi:hypothetical protein